MAHHVLVDDLAIFLGMLQHVRTGTHNRHVVPKHVDELRELIDTGLAQEIAPLGLTRVILGGLNQVGLVVHLHAAELQASELFTVVTAAFLFEEYRTRHGNLGDNSHDDVDPPENQDQEKKRCNNVEETLDGAVVRQAQRLIAHSEHRHVIHILHGHTTVQEVVHIGHGVKVDEVVLTAANNLPDAFRHGIGLVAEHQINLSFVLIEIGHHIRHISQSGQLFSQMLRDMIFKIALNDISGSEVLGQTVVDGLQVHSGSHEDSIALHGTAPAVLLDPHAAEETGKNQCHDNTNGDEPPRHAVRDVIRLYAVYQNLSDINGGHQHTTPQTSRSNLVQTYGTVLGYRVPEEDGDEIGHVEEEPVQ